MKGFIATLNTVSENVWAVLIILAGAGVGIAALRFHDLLGVAQAIVAAGCMAFKGHNGSGPPAE
jgi:hypothetical protein